MKTFKLSRLFPVPLLIAVIAASGGMGLLPFSAQNAAYANPALDDTQAPSIPTGLSATAASGSQLDLAWTASTDDVGVTGYKIYRDGTLIGTSPSPSYDDTGASPNTRSAYTVSAYDAGGNDSEPSQASVMVLCASASQADVTAAIGATDYGDTVVIPPCELDSCRWTSGIVFTKGNYSQPCALSANLREFSLIFRHFSAQIRVD